MRKKYMTYRKNNVHKHDCYHLHVYSGQLQKHIQHRNFMYYIDTHNFHTHVSYHINIMMTYIHVIILTHVIFEYAICTIHKNIYVLLKNYNNVHFSY